MISYKVSDSFVMGNKLPMELNQSKSTISLTGIFLISLSVLTQPEIPAIIWQPLF